MESNTFPLTAKFNFFDARAARLNQSVFDLGGIENLHSASGNLKANIKAAQNARDLAVLAVAGCNLLIVAAKRRIAAATAKVETSQAAFIVIRYNPNEISGHHSRYCALARAHPRSTRPISQRSNAE